MKLLTILLLLALPVALRAQFNFVTNNGAITITSYTGAGGAVVIPGSTNGFPVTTLGNGAFSNKVSITGVSIPNSVTSIGTNAFYNCTGLPYLVIPAGVTNLGDKALWLSSPKPVYFLGNPPGIGVSVFYPTET